MLQPWTWPTPALPHIEVAGRFPLDVVDHDYVYKSAFHALHLHFYHGSIRFDDHEVALHPGSLTLSTARSRTSYSLPERGEHLCIHFQPAGRQGGSRLRLPLIQRLGPREPFVAQRMMHIITLFSRARANPKHRAIAAAGASAALLDLLVVCSLDVDASPEAVNTTVARDAIDRVARLIHDEFRRDLTVDDYVDVSELSQGYLARKFKQHYGCTMQQFLIQRRVDVATRLLQSTRMPIKQIAAESGFNQLAYFHRIFRKVTGQTPAQMRSDATQ